HPEIVRDAGNARCVDLVRDSWMPTGAGMTAWTGLHAAPRRARQSRFAVRRQSTQHRFHGARRAREAQWHPPLAPALSGPIGGRTPGWRARAAAVARDIHERLGAFSR